MPNRECAVNTIGSLVAAAMLTDHALEVEGEQVRFQGSFRELEEFVTHALNTAIHVVPYQLILEILRDVQRKQLLAAGRPVPLDDGESEMRRLAS